MELPKNYVSLGPIVQEPDIYHIKEKWMLPILKRASNFGMVVAGGYARYLYHQNKNHFDFHYKVLSSKKIGLMSSFKDSDIDIFRFDDKDFNVFLNGKDVYKQPTQTLFSELFEHKGHNRDGKYRAISNFRHRNTKINFQFIHDKYADNVFELLDFFDFTICKIALVDGELIAHKNFEEDEKNRLLRFEQKKGKEEEGLGPYNNPHHHLIRYLEKGYRVNLESLIRIMDYMEIYVDDFFYGYHHRIEEENFYTKEDYEKFKFLKNLKMGSNNAYL